jgi:serine/threonine protein phosphatase 1
MRYFVLSDVHSFYNEMVDSLTKAGWFDYDGEKKIVICGDLLDRGNYPNEVVSFVLNLINNDQVILIRGNHEDLIEQLVVSLPMYDYANLIYSHHWSNGTVETLMKITNRKLTDLLSIPKLVIEDYNNGDFKKKVLPKMVDYFETPNHIFVHGWIPCGELVEYEPNWRNVTKEQWNNARWTNGMAYWKSGVREPNKTIVCGHWHCSYGWSHIRNEREEFPSKKIQDWKKSFEPFVDDGIIALDGCTAYSGIVNCVVIDD